MARPDFIDQLKGQWDEGKFLSVGLDADTTKLPTHLKNANRHRSTIQASFVIDIVDKTASTVLAYKPNIAFFEDDPEGEEALQKVIQYIHTTYPKIPVILDAKRGDISNTNRGYAKTAWGRYGADAVTVHSYLGESTYPPFLNYKDREGNEVKGKGIIALCKTSNPDSSATQDLVVDFNESVENGSMTDEERRELNEKLQTQNKARYYLINAYRHGKLNNINTNIGIVVGATYPESFAPVRQVFDGTILIPGIGTQGGDLEKTLQHAADSKGEGMIINSASGIIFASNDKDFATIAGEKAKDLDNQIRQLRTSK